jgi:hypothetical protein
MAMHMGLNQFAMEWVQHKADLFKKHTNKRKPRWWRQKRLTRRQRKKLHLLEKRWVALHPPRIENYLHKLHFSNGEKQHLIIIVHDGP